jgi:hypothetical protein
MRKLPFYLTKSRFKTALECPTKLFYTDKENIYANKKSEDEFLMALAEGGFQVGELAKLYFPDGYDVKPLAYDESLAETAQQLKNHKIAIYEAAIQFDQFFIRVDVLNKNGSDVELVEVKAKSFDPADPDFTYKRSSFIRPGWRPYLFDVAFQTWVTQQAFPEWNITPYLMMADKTKVASVDGLNQLFRIRVVESDSGRKECEYIGTKDQELGDEILTKVDVTEYVEQIWDGKSVPDDKRLGDELLPFADRARKYAKYYKEDIKLGTPIGTHCKDCEFRTEAGSALQSGYEECWKEQVGSHFSVDEPHIFDIWDNRDKETLLHNKIYLIRDMKDGYSFSGKRGPRKDLQVLKVQNNDESEFIDPDLFLEMDRWTFPLHFIDFETSMVAIPFYAGKRPYEQLAFQFSCHTYYDTGSVTHSEWISAEAGEFPNYDFVKALKTVLDQDEGTVFRYAAHENTVLNQIRKQMIDEGNSELDELIDWIPTITIIDKDEPPPERAMVDMLQLVQNYYYQKDMGGSNSLKSVLPTIMNHSAFIKNKYAQPMGYGTHLRGEIVWQNNNNNGKAVDPYKLLPPLFEGIDISSDTYLDGKGLIRDGGAAMMAYMLLQFSDLDSDIRKRIVKGLLKYCELDTLAMVLLYEHWKSLSESKYPC